MFRSSPPMVNLNGAMNPAREDREDEKKMLPCRFFVSGFCHRGTRCKFFHPNMHGRDPVIRVPDLPAEFSMVPQYVPYDGSQGDRVGSLLELSPRTRGLRPNRRMKTTLASPLDFSPQRRSSFRDPFRGFMTPSSNAYAEYMACSRFQGPFGPAPDEEDIIDEFSDSASADESKPSAQNTVFNHIDWSEFLTPGVRPPPPTNVPEQASTTLSPARIVGGYKDDITRFSPMSAKSYNKDMPPEGLQTREDQQELLEMMEKLDGNSKPKPKKMSAKEELKLKVKQLAKELANEPVVQTRSTDSFFQDEKNGIATSGSATGSPVKAAKSDGMLKKPEKSKMSDCDEDLEEKEPKPNDEKDLEEKKETKKSDEEEAIETTATPTTEV